MRNRVIAQSAEQEPFKLKVVGSIPTRPTIFYPITVLLIYENFSGLFVVAFFLVLKIIFNLNKEFLGRNFFRLDDIVNLLIVLFILIFIYKNKERFVQK